MSKQGLGRSIYSVAGTAVIPQSLLYCNFSVVGDGDFDNSSIADGLLGYWFDFNQITSKSEKKVYYCYKNPPYKYSNWVAAGPHNNPSTLKAVNLWMKKKLWTWKLQQQPSKQVCGSI